MLMLKTKLNKNERLMGKMKAHLAREVEYSYAHDKEKLEFMTQPRDERWVNPNYLRPQDEVVINAHDDYESELEGEMTMQ